MARIKDDLTVTLSVLDRLIDTEPKTQVESRLTRSQSVRQMKRAVRRDLEWLLNSRRIPELPGESLKELNRSVYLFGLPDFTAYTSASAADRTNLARQILSAVKLFEPRLTDVRIVPVDVAEAGVQEFRFRIEGLLLMDPSPERISFDTTVESKTNVCRLTGGPDAG
jgi:type VI secretion system protein ImpF